MSLRGYMLLAAGLVFGGVLFSQVQKNGSGGGSAGPDGSSDKKPVDVRAERSYFDKALNASLGIDEQAMIMVGAVAFHHNGAVISCDSAVRYSDRRIECFKNVIINKDSTFVYGDRAEYNGDANLARVYSPVIKVIDGDATLYTTNRFTFNTRDNIGTWNGGGVVYQQDNVLESERGYFYSDLHEMVAVRNVQMKNDSHQIISDSVRYNTETKIAHFYTRTYIWTQEGEMISALQGRYNTQDSTYFFHNNAYILDEFRETWADTIDFNARVEDAIFYGNVQIDDNEHDSSAFGDLAHYWGERGETRLTRRPSLLNYDAEQGNADTLYMRADTVYMFVRYPSDSRRSDSLGGAEGGMEDEDRFAHLKWVDSLSDSVRLVMADSLATVIADLRQQISGLRRHADSIMEVLYPTPVAVPDVPNMSEIADTLSLIPPEVLPDTLPSVQGTPPTDANLLPPVADSLTALLDSLPAPDSLATMRHPEDMSRATGSVPLELEAAPTPEPEPEKIAPPEVVELRGRVTELSVRADSLSTAENYIRPRAKDTETSAGAVDSLARLRLDSISRADSLVRMDSIRTADPKTYKRLQKAEAKRIKATKARLAAERREAKYAAKAAARLEKQRLRAEKRAAKAAAKAAGIAARRKGAGLRGDNPLLDSLVGLDPVWRDSVLRFNPALLDSLAGLDPIWRDSIPWLDSLLCLDSIMSLDSLRNLDSLPPHDSVATEPDTTLRIFRGWYNVRIWRKDMQAVCDSIVGFSVDSTLHMYTDPILWHADSQVTSDSTILYTAGQQIERAEFFGDPIMGSQVEGPTSRRFNQVKGRTMTSWFREGALQRHDADGNAQALYYMQEEEPGPDGGTILSEAQAFIVMTAANISFIFENDSLRYIVPRDNVPYTVFPIDQIPSTQPTQMQGFVWRIERQPTLADVFDRTVRPSEREFYEGLSRPEFPIAARIERRREYLIENRMWADRVDPLPAYAVEFRREKYVPPPDQQAQ